MGRVTTKAHTVILRIWLWLWIVLSPFASHRRDCHSLVQQNSRNIIDDIIIFHLTTDFGPDADVPTVFFRLRFVAIFLLVRFFLAICGGCCRCLVWGKTNWDVMVAAAWAPHRTPPAMEGWGWGYPVAGVTQPNSVLLFICSIVFVALRPLSVGPLEINVNGICLSISENKYKIKASLKQIAQ